MNCAVASPVCSKYSTTTVCSHGEGHLAGVMVGAWSRAVDRHEAIHEDTDAVVADKLKHVTRPLVNRACR